MKEHSFRDVGLEPNKKRQHANNFFVVSRSLEIAFSCGRKKKLSTRLPKKGRRVLSVSHENVK